MVGNVKRDGQGRSNNLKLPPFRLGSFFGMGGFAIVFLQDNSNLMGLFLCNVIIG